MDGGEGGWRQTSLKTPWNFEIFYFIPGNSRQNKASPLETPENCVTPPRIFKT